MFDSLPPLNALRAFEAAARRLSFKNAARELHVTPGAVSQQVKLLEEHLQQRLFLRQSRGISLTEAGKTLFQPLTEALTRINDAAEKLVSQEATGLLTVSTIPSFAAKWLVPRLNRFNRQHPEIDLRLSASNNMVKFDEEDVDLGIRAGSGSYKGLFTEFLMSEEMFPVCAPALLQGEHPLHHPQDLRHHTLLHDENTANWEDWLQHHKVEGVNPLRGPILSDAAMILQLAIDGQGVAISRSVLIEDDIRAGRLVKPFALSLPQTFDYYLVCPQDNVRRPKIQAFMNWLRNEVQNIPKF